MDTKILSLITPPVTHREPELRNDDDTENDRITRQNFQFQYVTRRVIDGEFIILEDEQGKSLSWRDSDLDKLSVLHVDRLETAEAEKIFLVFVYGLLGGSVPYFPLTVYVLAMQAISPKPAKEYLLDNNVGQSTDKQNEAMKIIIAKWSGIIAGFNHKDILSENLVKEVMAGLDQNIISVHYLHYLGAIQQLTGDEDTTIGVAQLINWMLRHEGKEVLSFIGFICFSSFRIINCKIETIRNKLNTDFLIKFEEFYNTYVPMHLIRGIQSRALSCLKKYISIGKIITTSLMAAAVKRYVLHRKGIAVMDCEDYAILQYCVLKSTTYTGLYMADIITQAIVKTNIKPKELLTTLRNEEYEEEYRDLFCLLECYILFNSDDRYGWKWSRVFQHNYLLAYSAQTHPWICALFTAIVHSDPTSSVWKNKCFENQNELISLAKYWAEVFYIVDLKNSQSERDGIYLRSARDRIIRERIECLSASKIDLLHRMMKNTGTNQIEERKKNEK